MTNMVRITNAVAEGQGNIASDNLVVKCKFPLECSSRRGKGQGNSPGKSLTLKPGQSVEIFTRPGVPISVTEPK